MIPNRIKRVSNLLMSEISEVIRREVKDPRMELASITSVKVTKDLSAARVYVSVLGDPGKLDDVVGVLNRAGGFIRRRVQERIVLKRVPELKFFGDDSIQRGVRICSLIDKVMEEEEKEQ